MYEFMSATSVTVLYLHADLKDVELASMCLSSPSLINVQGLYKYVTRARILTRRLPLFWLRVVELEKNPPPSE